MDVTANLNDAIWGSARLQVRTDTGDFNQVGANLYQAQAACTWLGEPFHIAQRGNIDPVLACQFENSFVFMGTDVAPVNFECLNS